jgi:hypothetical protein
VIRCRHNECCVIRNRFLWLIVAVLFLPSAIQLQADKSEPKPLPTLDVVFVSPVQKVQPPDYLAIRRANDERVAAEEAEAARLEALRLEQEAQMAASTPLPVPSGIAVSSDVIAAITKWASYYGVDANWLLRIAQCESGLNQSATNYGYSAGGGNPHGVFQFLPQTFYGNGGRDYDSFDDQARVAAYMFHIGQSGQWECR